MMDGIRNSNLPTFAPARAGSAANPAEPVRRTAPAGPVAGSLAGTGAASLVADLAAAPPVDAVRVAAIKAGIEAGSFRIDPDAIAAAMLRLDRGRP